ncbi:hypothetical protein V3N99_09695 [Dermatophilaceae bacterium Soc4.6]
MFPRAVVVDSASTYEGDLWGEHSGDEGALEVSRRRILTLADVVVPGHGAPFTVAASDRPPS